MEHTENGTIIKSWSGRELTARKHYTCSRCGGPIVSGTKYVRDVVRFPSQSRDEPRVNRHYHRDCETPWDQADNHHHLRHLGQLKTVVKDATYAGVAKTQQSRTIVINDKKLGVMQWTLPANLTGHSSATSERVQSGAHSEIELVMRLLMQQLQAVSGDKRKALQLSHVLSALTQT